MAKKILVLNGCARKNGNTAKLIRAFTEGAEEAGHTVEEFYLQDMKINGCIGCQRASRDPENPCVQKDDMGLIYKAFVNCDVVVFASPVYFWTVSGTLKTAVDRLYAEFECLGSIRVRRESVLLMTAGSTDYVQALAWYRRFEQYCGWKNRGEVLGAGKTEEARKLGLSL